MTLKKQQSISRRTLGWFAKNQPPRNHRVPRCHWCRANEEEVCISCRGCISCCSCEWREKMQDGFDGDHDQ